MVGIYKITSPSGNVYIGQTWNYKRRLYEYKSLGSCKRQIHIFRSLSKYGFDKHQFELVHKLPNDITQDIMDNYEILYYNQYKNLKVSMLNSREPGKGGKLTQQAKEKLSISHIGKIHSDNTKLKISQSLIGKKRGPHSEEAKLKMRNAKLGKKYLQSIEN
jgi:group I intron endonuclease